MKLLQRCVDSIPKRDDVQIIVVDDNSDDDKKPMISRPNTKVIMLGNEDSKGAGHARNVGLKNAEGKWLLFPDADDFYSSNFLDHLDEHKDSDADVIYFNYNRITKDGRKYNNASIESYSGIPADLDMIRYKTNAPWNKMVNKEFIMEKHIVFEEAINGNDMFFTYQIGYFATNISVDKYCIYNYDTSVYGMTNKKKNTKEYYLCRLNHWYQANEFFSFVGHREWKYSILKRFGAILVKKGVGQFLLCLFLYIINVYSIVNNRFFFVETIRRLSVKK